MPHPRPVALVASLLTLATAGPPAAAQPMLDRVPDDAVVYVGWRGADDLGEGYEGSRLQGVLSVVELEETFAQIAAAIRAVGEAEAGSGFPAELGALRPMAEAAWRHPTAVYVSPPADAGGEPRLVVMCRAGDDAAALRAELTKVFEGDGGGKLSVAEADGVVHVLAGGVAGGGVPAAPARSLAAAGRYTTAIARVDADAAVVAYFDVAGMLAWAERDAVVIEAAMDGEPRGVGVAADAEDAAVAPPPAAAAAEDEPRIIVHVKADGTVVYGGRPLTTEQLVDALAPVAAADDGVPVVLRADRDAEFAAVSGVLTALTEAGLKNVAMTTQDPPPADGGDAAHDRAAEPFGGAGGVARGGGPSVEQARQAVSATGIDAVDAVAVSAGFFERDWQTRVFVGVAAPRRGLAALVDEPFDPTLLRLVPVDAPAASLIRLDPKELLAEVRRTAAAIDPQRGLEQVNDALAQASTMVGVDVETQLIDALGPDWVAYTDVAATGGGLPGLVIANRLRDAEAADAALRQLGGVLTRMVAEKMADQPASFRVVTTERDGLTVHALTAVFVTPSWAIHDGVLYAALLPQPLLTARDHAQRLKQRDARPKTILDRPAFREMSRRLGGPDIRPVAFGFVDVPEAIDGAYPSAVMLGQMLNSGAAMFADGGMPMLLPPLSRLKPHLSAAGSVIWADDAGLHARTIEPFPLATSLASPLNGGSSMTVAPLAVGVLLPALGSARTAARKAAAQSNARGIVQAYVVYMMENNDKPPAEPGALLKDQMVAPQMYVSPWVEAIDEFDAEADVATMSAWVRSNSAYVVMADIDGDFNAEQVSLFLDPDYNGGDSGTAVGYGDGHVAWVEIEELRRQVKQQTGKSLDEVIAAFRKQR